MMKEKQRKNERKKKGKAVCTSIFFSLCILGILAFKMDVRASEEIIKISGLCVRAEGNGITARCIYENFDSSRYMIQIYLEKMEDQEAFPIAYEDLTSADEAEQEGKTEICRNGTGIYRAVLLIRSSGEMTVVKFQNSGWYEAIDKGDHYEVRPYDPESEENDKDVTEEDWKVDSGNDACGHKLVQEICTEATSQEDAVYREICELCGQVMGYGEIPNSAYSFFLNNVIDKINEAQPDEKVCICTDRWISFDRSVLDAIEARKDIEVLISYRYRGTEYQVLIPKGVDVICLADENGFCGFRYLDQIFGEKIDG